jgi:hypothetical protein
MLTSYTKITDIPYLKVIINVLNHYKPERKFVEGYELNFAVLPLYANGGEKNMNLYSPNTNSSSI